MRKYLILFLLAASPASAQIKTITGGGYQYPNGTTCSGCTLTLQLTVDATVSGTGQIVPKQISYILDGSGNVPAGSTIWGNDQLLPNGTTYKASLAAVGGGQLWGPEYLSIAGTSPINLAQLIPVANPAVFFSNPAVTNLNNTFTANNNFTGANAFIGGPNTFNCKQIETALCVDAANTPAWAGVDLCAWVNSAQAGAPATGGTIWVFPANGTTTCAGTLAIGSTTQGIKTQWFGTFTIKVQNSITLAQASRMECSGNQSGSVGVTPCVFQAGTSFPASTYLVVAGPASGVADAVYIKDAFFDCNGVSGCKGMNIQNVQEDSGFRDITVIHNLGNGVDITGTSEDFDMQNMNVIAGAAATADNCYTLGTAANHINFISDGCTSGAASPSTGAGILCTGCNMEVQGFHAENHVDGVLLSGSSPNHGYANISGINNAVAMTNLVHVASNWGGTLSLNGARLFVGTNTVKNDESAFNHVCTDAVLEHYNLGWATGNPNVIQLDTNCSTLPSIRSATFAISGTTAGNFSPDASALLDIRGPSATFNGIRMVDTTSGNSFYVGPGAGTTGFGIRDQLNSKQGLIWAGNTGTFQFLQGMSVSANVLFSPTAPTIAAAGCGGAAASVVVSNGTAAFKINVGTTPTSACTITMPTATTGWNVTCNDITTQSTAVFVQKQTGAESTTSVTITNFNDVAVATAFVASDILKCTASAD